MMARYPRWPAGRAGGAAVVTLCVLGSPLAEAQDGQPLQPVKPLASRATGDEPGTSSEWTQWTSGRYRITPGDVLELRFPFVPELDQTLAVQPDGYVTLREVGDIGFQGRTLEQLRELIRTAYEPIVRHPVFTLVLKEFEKPYFVAAGEVNRPGRYDLRGATTLTQALAFAGGPTGKGRMTEVVLFRRFAADMVEVKQVNVKEMYGKRDLSEDPVLRPGDTVFVPISTLGKLAPILSKATLGLYLNPLNVFGR
jgi:polysaccharide export outer membrane protein